MSISIYGDAKDVQFALTRKKVEALNGKIVKVFGPPIVAMGLKDANMADVVRVGEQCLIGKILNMNGDTVSIQVYEETPGLGPGAMVETAGAPMSMELSPDIIEDIYDGIQRPLEGIMRKAGNNNLPRGMEVPALDREKRWDFTAVARPGDRVAGGDMLGTVQEISVVFHKAMIFPTLSGAVEFIQSGSFTVLDTVVVLVDGKGEKHALIMVQKWPIHVGRPYKHKYPPRAPLLSDQYIMDAMLPVTKDGTATIPRSLGSGKAVMQYQLAKWSGVDIVVHIDCGERGNEMADVLRELPELVNLRTGESLMKWTVLIANTSDMSVAAREVSIYTGVTIAEYSRNMGYGMAVIADSASHWAEALREMSGRLEEMPNEEGHPTYLSSRLAWFYERAGTVECIGSDEYRRGSPTAMDMVSPPGNDLSEPVSQATMRIVKVFWALDASLAYKRHFLAVDQLSSYSLYLNSLKPWYGEHLEPQFVVNHDKAMSIPQEKASLNEIVQLVGKDSLSAADQFILETAKMLREDFLWRNGSTEADWYPSCEHQDKTIQMIPDYDKLCHAAIKRGAATVELFAIPFREQIGRTKNAPDDRHVAVYTEMTWEVKEQIVDIAARGGAEE